MGSTRQVEFRITPSIKKKIVEIVDERIREAHVTREDFSELKEIVKELAVKVGALAEAQQKTEQKVEELAQAQRQLAEAQRRTEERVEQLAEAQQKTEQKVEQLAEAQRKTEEEVRNLAIGLRLTREELGGLDRTLGYAFENEAYRMLPKFLKERYGLEMKERLIRTEIAGKEINFFGRAEKDGKEVYIIGEAKTRLDDRKKVEEILEDLAEKIEVVKKEYGEVEIVSLLVTHFATKGILNLTEEKGVIVIQSYEW